MAKEIESNPAIKQDFFKESKDGKNFLVHRQRPAFVVVNNSGLEMIELFDGRKSIRDVGIIIAEKYGVDKDKVVNDIIILIKKLEKSGFLESNHNNIIYNENHPETLSIHLTDKCNLSCIHCYNESNPYASDELPFSKVKKLIKDFKSLGGRNLSLTGGDSLLHPDFFDILKISEEFEVLSVLTNGTNVDEKSAQILSDCRARIQISLDGSNPEINDLIRGGGSFKKIMKGIENLQNKGAGERIVISTTAMKQNIEDVPAIIELVEKIGIKFLRCLPLRCEGCARWNWSGVSVQADIEEYYCLYKKIDSLKTAKKGSIDIETGFSKSALNMNDNERRQECLCPIGRTFSVYANGDIFPCPIMMDKKFLAGNINKLSLEDIINSEKVSELKKLCIERRDKISICSACIWKNFCQGGCAAVSFLQKGTIFETDDYCNLRKEFLNNALWGSIE